MTSLFDQPKAEAVLQSLLDTTKKHSQELSLLRKLYDFSSSPPDGDCSEGGILLAKIKKIEERIETLSDKVDGIEKAIQIPSSNAVCTVGEGVAANRKTLARTLNLVAAKADAEHVKEQAASSRRQVDETIQELKQTLAGNASLEKINAAVSSLSQRIDVISSDLKNKVDDSTIKVLQSDASIIQNHAAFVKKTNDTIQKAEGELATQDGTISKHTEELEALTDKLSSLQNDVARRAVAKDLAALLHRVEDISSTIKEKSNNSELVALKTSCDEKNQRIAKVEADLESLISSLAATSAQMSSQITEHREAVGRLVSGCVSREALGHALCELHAELQQKAWAENVENMERSLAELCAEFAVTKKKSDLSAQFVSWYGNRGDSYEHNLHAVDEHLKKLAR